ncbi:MAG TPA: 2OG-Fe(II) oxygenase [Burkholderiales bacterium]
MGRGPAALEAVADALAADGLCIRSDFFPAELITALARDAHARFAEFQPAGTGAGPGRALRPQVRGDSTLWLESPGRSRAQRAALARFEMLRLALNGELHLGLFDFECHFAVYPPGAGYRRHFDRLAGDAQFAGAGGRVLSCVLYLNRHWPPEDGGQLRLYRPGAPALDVAPQGGTLVVFLSDRFEHEVLPARRERLSLTGWFRRRGQHL